MAEKFQNYIGGRWVDASTGETFQNRNPANRDDLVGIFPRSSARDVDDAVSAARAAFAAWKSTPAPKRGQILLETGRILRDRKDEIARVMTREMGKIIKETRGDVQEGIDTADYAAGEGRRLFGETVPCELPSKMGFSIRQPVGVCGMITPWNFPMAIPTWKIFPALVSGNTVVFKPATDTPSSAAALIKALEEAGLPAGVCNLVFGSGSGVGGPLTEHAGVNLISFTGSTEVGRQIAEVCGRGLKRLSLEMGGKNAQIVMADADLDLALDGALWGAFGTTGQRCTATSRLIVEKSIRKELTERLVERASSLRVGDGLDEAVEVGPLINSTQVDRVEKYVQIGKDEGARLILGGHRLDEGA
ncbi:MAG: aldehyde dehydrogenase family protein, partial [Planctomycetota bacterium]|nr:aldehyde dehydrogenase family protein [Planctomycetota bacterium]